MKHIHFISLLIVAVIFSSCIRENHHLDGKYRAEIPFIGTIHHTINGNEITIENPITGISKLECRQYEDRVEYIEENNGLKRVLTKMENGDLKFSDLIILEKIEGANRGGSTFGTKDQPEALSSSKQLTEEKETYTNHNENAENISSDAFDNVPTKIKKIVRKGDRIYLTVDIMQMITNADGNIEVINENPKLRTYIVDVNVNIRNSSCEEINFSGYVWDNRERILSLMKTYGFIMITTDNKGRITHLNLGCWS